MERRPRLGMDIPVRLPFLLDGFLLGLDLPPPSQGEPANLLGLFRRKSHSLALISNSPAPGTLECHRYWHFRRRICMGKINRIR